MSKTSFHVLRVGIAITFLWIGMLILKEPQAWGSFIQPWALKLLPTSIEQMMTTTAFLDIIVGIFLLLDSFVWLASFVATVHLFIVLTVSGINEVTVRDIGLLASTIALFFESLPTYISSKFTFGRTKEVG